MHGQLTNLLNRKMDRRDFLKHIGVGMLALLGLSAAMRALSGGEYVTQTNASSSGQYNNGLYGGNGRGTSDFSR